MTEHTTLVTPELLAAHLDEPEWVVLDCRYQLGAPRVGQEAFEAAHLPGAHYVDLERDLAGPVTPASGRHPLPEPGEIAAKIGGWGIDRQSQVVVYDDAGGATAARAWWTLRWLGHEAVALLDGGFSQWQRGGYPTTQDRSVSERKVFRPRLRNALREDLEGVLRNLKQSTFALVDARAEARFRGIEEPIDKVAGHVPGALSRPFQQNLDADGRFRPATELRAEWSRLLEERAPREVVHMCGSGVTACHNILAMEVAGLEGSILYPGSWSEWIRDPKRPVVSDA